MARMPYQLSHNSYIIENVCFIRMASVVCRYIDEYSYTYTVYVQLLQQKKIEQLIWSLASIHHPNACIKILSTPITGDDMFGVLRFLRIIIIIKNKYMQCAINDANIKRHPLSERFERNKRKNRRCMCSALSLSLSRLNLHEQTIGRAPSTQTRFVFNYVQCIGVVGGFQFHTIFCCTIFIQPVLSFYLAVPLLFLSSAVIVGVPTLLHFHQF